MIVDKQFFFRTEKVSIPLWFDSNTVCDLRTDTSREFQFHSGSIQTPQLAALSCAGQLVSIPLWFDSNLTLPIPQPDTNVVSIPLWFDSNRIASATVPLVFHVSIPLWFDSNVNANGSTTTALFVSIPLWFDSNYVVSFVCQNNVSVSIPLWFDSNSSVRIDMACPKWFQFHSGSIQTSPLTQHLMMEHHWFQFHSGSIQTQNARMMFCFNFGCFNSTLVRFKPWLRSTLVAITLLFQFHSGSIQTELDELREWEHNPVSIPLWFDSNPSGRVEPQEHFEVSIPLWFDSNRRT